MASCYPRLASTNKALPIARDSAKSHFQSFSVDDRVARLLPDNANKLKYLWSGPYRVSEVLPDARYKLRDLENRLIHDEFDSSHLRPYRTVVDAEDLASDEYIIDRLDGHRDRRGQREYRVKWRGYPMSQSTWEPRAEIERRAASLVESYEEQLAKAEQPPHPLAGRRPRRPRPPLKEDGSESPGGLPGVPEAEAPATKPHYESDDLPSVAKLERGEWTYGTYQATPRGRRIRWHPERYYAGQVDSDHLATLRDNWLAGAGEHVVAVIHEIAQQQSTNKWLG